MTLADALLGKPLARIAGKGRVHRMGDDPEEEQPTDEQGRPVPVITPFDATAGCATITREKKMPRLKKSAAAADATEPVPAKRKYTKRAKVAAPKGKKRRDAIGAARFQIDDRGGMSIEDGQQVIKIERDDVKRLEEFLAHTKAIRT